MKQSLWMAALLAMVASGAEARDVAVASKIANQGCMNEQATIYVNINFTESELTKAIKGFEESGKMVEQLASKMGIEKMQMTGENYSLSMNGSYGSPRQFNMSGNRNYMLPTTEKAQKLFTKLVDEGMQANLNVNRNWNQYGGCTSGVAE